MKSDAGRDLENKVRQTKSSKYLDSKRVRLMRDNPSSVASEIMVACDRLAIKSRRTPKGVLNGLSDSDTTTRE